MKETSSPDDFPIPPFDLRRKINDELMMSVGRLIVFDIMQAESLAAAQKVIETNEFYLPKDRAKYSPRIILVGDSANM
jgi:hypothetical protein